MFTNIKQKEVKKTEQYLTLIPTGVATLLAIIGWCISLKGKSKREKTLKLAQILKELPNLILSAEKSGFTGISKQKMVLIDIQKLCLEKQIEYNEEQWQYEIEKILTTPQKKEAINGEEKQTNQKD